MRKFSLVCLPMTLALATAACDERALSNADKKIDAAAAAAEKKADQAISAADRKIDAAAATADKKLDAAANHAERKVKEAGDNLKKPVDGRKLTPALLGHRQGEVDAPPGP